MVDIPLRRARRRLPRINVLLAISGLMVLTLVICAVFAPLIAPHDPGAAIIIRSGASLARAPYPPGTAETPWGSDSLRRDMLSRLIYGSRYTLLFCGVAALIRVLIGATLGALAAWYRSVAWFVNTFAGAFSAVPSLIFALIPLTLINARSTPDQSVIAFVIVLSITGWSETAIRTQLAVEALRGTAFVEAAYSIGLPHNRVLWRHVLPNLRDLLAIEVAYAMGATLLLLAELGFLGTFLGGGLVQADGNQVLATETLTAEWGNMLAQGFRERNLGAWLFLEPLFAFVFAIVACNLLAEGLRRRR